MKEKEEVKKREQKKRKEKIVTPLEIEIKWPHWTNDTKNQWTDEKNPWTHWTKNQ